MDLRRLLPLLTEILSPGAVLRVPDDEVRDAVRSMLPAAVVADGSLDPADPDRAPGTPDGPVDAVLLLAGELAHTGERAPVVLEEAVRACRPGGHVVALVPSALWNDLTGASASAGLTSGQLSHMLAERGLEVRLLAAPGAAARVAGREWAGAADLELDRQPGLLDAGPTILAVGRTPRNPTERTRVFFTSIDRKIVAASVLCRDDQERVLLVYDTFKQAWTLPGGLVDAGESPIDGAVREAHEEGGVDVVAGALLGVFAHDRPDRIHLVYAAAPVRPTPDPTPVHTHEVSSVRWVSVDEAYTLLDAHMRRKLHDCLTEPGRTWCW